MADDYYTGPVAYQDGWHHAVTEDSEGNATIIGDRLVLEDTEDGSASRYRLATEADTRSWHDRKHRQYVSVVMEDGTAVKVTPDEMQAIQELLNEKRGGG